MPASPLKHSAREIDRHIGQRLRLARKAHDLSLTRLADALGVTYQQIQKYETGSNRISASTLWSLGRILGVVPAFFYVGLEPNEAQSPALDIEEDIAVKDFTTRLTALPLSDRRFVLLMTAQVIGHTEARQAVA